MNKLIAFGWYGGKYSHLDWLLPLLPEAKHYCEPFGGSAAVLINREPAPVETYNDIDGEVANFFRVLRNQKEALIEAIGLTPFSREEFEVALAEPDRTLTDLERARRFYVLARQVRTGLAQTASSGRWAVAAGGNWSPLTWEKLTPPFSSTAPFPITQVMPLPPFSRSH